jgi:hypothetical protein
MLHDGLQSLLLLEVLPLHLVEALLGFVNKGCHPQGIVAGGEAAGVDTRWPPRLRRRRESRRWRASCLLLLEKEAKLRLPLQLLLLEDRGRSELLLLEDRCLRCGSGLCGGVLAAGLLVGVAACLRGRALESVTACLRGRELAFPSSIVGHGRRSVWGTGICDSSVNKMLRPKSARFVRKRGAKSARFVRKRGAKNTTVRPYMSKRCENGAPARRSKSTAAEASLPR